MQKCIIYVRTKQGDLVQAWKQLLILLEYAKEIDFQILNIIAVTEDDNQYNRSSIEHLLKKLKDHSCCSVLVMDSRYLSDDPEELAKIKDRFANDGVTVISYSDNKQSR